MCTLLFAYDVHPEARLVVAANRDEARARASAPLHAWADLPLVGGRDLVMGGTWMGVSPRGRWAALTNTREPGRAGPAPRSRGALVTEFLTADAGARAVLTAMAARADAYAGFNLVAWDGRALLCLSTFGGAPRLEEVAPGVHGLSNHRLDTPWPKVQVGKDRLRALVTGGPLPGVDALLGLLGDRRGFADSALPDTGVGLAHERILAPILIDTPGYGTRSSTAMIVDRRGHVTLAELTRDPIAAADRGRARVDLSLDLDLDDLAADP